MHDDDDHGDDDGEGLFACFAKPGSSLSVVIEDDGRVAYAYLRDGDDVVGDVWLYNVGETPAAVDWRDPSQMPFANPRAYVRESALPRLRDAGEVACTWLDDGVELRFAGRLMARLRVGDKPGESWLAARPGPLAKPLVEAT